MSHHYYYYKSINKEDPEENEMGKGSIVDMERIFPLEILGVIQLYQDQSTRFSLNIESENHSYQIVKSKANSD
ncbi:hypothetical protein [Maribacter polysaccharolyticus]|uniref:hypothetical protein n=1 Tax=Maribacter polysaccharolyticus TaxID=3020831 RepID=UPI00237FB0F4|nr:hypothetical protein [Maribacter polysaccharolyticus]MDE3744068.1 hypothetical protein [Maribacter polysaccharolyticus]